MTSLKENETYVFLYSDYLKKSSTCGGYNNEFNGKVRIASRISHISYRVTKKGASLDCSRILGSIEASLCGRRRKRKKPNKIC